MKNGTLIAISVIAASLVACDKATNTNETSSSNNKRAISSELIASCPQNSLGRIAADTIPANTAYTNKAYFFSTRIYNQDGNFIGKIDGPISSDTMPLINSIKILWDGKDSTNTIMPTGNYFFFKTLTDTANNRTTTDSSCIKLVRG